MNEYISFMALATAFFFSINNPVQAHDHKTATKVGGLVISSIWARATPKTAKTGAVFFIIKNKGKTDDALVSVSSEIAKKTEIHQSSIENNIMKMRHVGKVDVPRGSMVELKQGSFHIMFIDLHAPIKQGDLFPMTLTFKTAGTVKIMVKASKVGKKSPIGHGKVKTK